MSTPPDTPPDSEDWPPPGKQAAPDPHHRPGHPLRAEDCEALLAKIID